MSKQCSFECSPGAFFFFNLNQFWPLKMVFDLCKHNINFICLLEKSVGIKVLIKSCFFCTNIVKHKVKIPYHFLHLIMSSQNRNYPVLLPSLANNIFWWCNPNAAFAYFLVELVTAWLIWRGSHLQCLISQYFLIALLIMTSSQFSSVDLRIFKFVLIINIESNLLFSRQRQVDGKFFLTVKKNNRKCFCSDFIKPVLQNLLLTIKQGMK